MLYRLKILKFTLIATVFLGLLVNTSCQTAVGLGILAWQLGVFDKKSSSGNSAPQILTLTAVPNTVALGDSAVLTVVAVDSDSSDLTYQWSAPTGTLVTPTAQVTTWIAPSDNTGTFIINVTVSDGKTPVTGKVPITVTL